MTTPSNKKEITVPVLIYRGLCLPRKKAGWAAFVMFLSPAGGAECREEKVNLHSRGSAFRPLGALATSPSPWTPKVGREQEEDSVGGAGLGTLWDRGVQPEARCPGTELQDLCLGPEQPHPSCWGEAGCPVREPKAQRLGRLPSRSQEAGLAGEQRKDRCGGGGESPWSPLRGTTDPCGATPSVEPRPSEPRPRGYHTPPRSHAPVEPHLAGPRPRRATPPRSQHPLRHPVQSSLLSGQPDLPGSHRLCQRDTSAPTDTELETEGHHLMHAEASLLSPGQPPREGSPGPRLVGNTSATCH